MDRASIEVSDVHMWDTLIVDDFLSGCLIEGQDYLVYTDEQGKLYIRCANGDHYLSFHLNEKADRYDGFFKTIRVPTDGV